jgi:hypothetical protein
VVEDIPGVVSDMARQVILSVLWVLRSKKMFGLKVLIEVLLLEESMQCMSAAAPEVANAVVLQCLTDSLHSVVQVFDESVDSPRK